MLTIFLNEHRRHKLLAGSGGIHPREMLFDNFLLPEVTFPEFLSHSVRILARDFTWKVVFIKNLFI